MDFVPRWTNENKVVDRKIKNINVCNTKLKISRRMYLDQWGGFTFIVLSSLLQMVQNRDIRVLDHLIDGVSSVIYFINYLLTGIEL